MKARADRPLESLTRKEVKVWYLGLGHAPTHANKALTYFRALFNWAIANELITCQNPALRIRRFSTTQRERFLTPEKLQRFMQGPLHQLPKIRASLLLGLFTGSRRLETRSIQRADLDEHTRLWEKLKQKNGVAQFVPLPVQSWRGGSILSWRLAPRLRSRGCWCRVIGPCFRSKVKERWL